MANIMKQSAFIPTPQMTEKNCPDQTGKVHVVTGGYGGVGFELCRILYGANANIYVVGRSPEKAKKAIEELQKFHPNSKGKLEFVVCDFSDLSTIKPATEAILKKEKRLDVLTNNAGVMFPPKGSQDKQGNELQMGTNCLGPFLFTGLLQPIMKETAANSPPGHVRVTWAGSVAIDVFSPRQGGIIFDEQSGEPKVLGVKQNYGQSKVGNLFLATESARRFHDSGIVHVCFNPGNLRSDLYRHMAAYERAFSWLGCYPLVYGAYTELWAALSDDITMKQNGAYVGPWGRIMGVRGDVDTATKTKENGGTGQADMFWGWCEKQTKAYL